MKVVCIARFVIVYVYGMDCKLFENVMKYLFFLDYQFLHISLHLTIWFVWLPCDVSQISTTIAMKGNASVYNAVRVV